MRLVVQKKRSADTEQLMVGGGTPFSVWWTWKRRASSAVVVSGDRPRKVAKLRAKRT
jgi:hypothetical protein